MISLKQLWTMTSYTLLCNTTKTILATGDVKILRRAPWHWERALTLQQQVCRPRNGLGSHHRKIGCNRERDRIYGWRKNMHVNRIQFEIFPTKTTSVHCLSVGEYGSWGVVGPKYHSMSYTPATKDVKIRNNFSWGRLAQRKSVRFVIFLLQKGTVVRTPPYTRIF